MHTNVREQVKSSLPKKSSACPIEIAMLSNETIQLQDEWSAQLGDTFLELQNVARRAAEHHEAYRAAMGRLGELYAYCGKLMLRANTPAIALPHPVPAAKDARRVAAHLQLSTDQWRQSADEVALQSFLAQQREEWAQYERELRRMFENNLKRRDLCRGIEKMRADLRKAQNSSAMSYVQDGYKGRILEAEASQKKLDDKICSSMEELVKRCSRNVLRNSTNVIELMSRSGQACAMSFQPIETVRLGSPTRQTSSASFGSPLMPTDTVVGVVLERTGASREGTADLDEASYSPSFTYLREDSAASPPPAPPAASASAAAPPAAHTDPTALK